MIRTRRLGLVLLTLLVISVPALSKDQWIQVRSKNFFLVGNASEKDIRGVATKLEQFRETFRLIFSGLDLKSPTPTRVLVFKSNSYYKQFKPKRGDGKIDNFVAGYFQPAEDVNYITLSTEGEDEQTFSVIFHEYVHSIVNTNFGKSEVPAWFNEGLAEYFSTFAIEDGVKAKLGLPLGRHLELLSQSKFIPLETLLSLSNSQMSNSGDHSRSIFYAEAWVLVHYLLRTGKVESLGKFLDLVVKGTPQEQAFKTAFQTDYGTMEGELRKYVSKNTYMYQEVTFKNKLVGDNDMTAAPLGDVDMNNYLGDLLAHIQREDDAEPFLKAALQVDPASSMANTTLGMVKMRQRKFDEAKKYLEIAIKDDVSNPQAYYNYAYLLSREGSDEFGYSRSIPKESADKMRSALKKAITLKPTFAPSYDLLAYVSVVSGEGLEEAAAVMQKALQIMPGDQAYALRLADIYSRLHKEPEAKAMIDKVLRTTDEPELRNRAEQMLNYLKQREDYERQKAEFEKAGGRVSNSGGDGAPMMLIKTDKPLSAAEMEKANAESTLRSMNALLRKPAEGEQRIIGRIEKIDCKKLIIYTVKTPTETFSLVSDDFQALDLSVFIQEADGVSVACDAKISAFNAVITFKPATIPNSPARGRLSAVEFVTPDFHFLTEEEMKQPPPRIVPIELVDEKGIAKDPMPTEADLDEARRNAMLKAIRDRLHQPGKGEKRVMGFLEKIECSAKGQFYNFRTDGGPLRLLVATAMPDINVFTPDLAGLKFGCNTKPIEFPALVVYKDAADLKNKTAGSVVALDFVPKSFTLEP